MNKQVSVVITTKNEEHNIRNCLESIKHQTWRNVEILVVDNASDDKTKEIAKEYTNFVFDKGPERSSQRNFGMIEQANGEYVIYVDADMLLSPILLEQCVNFIENNSDTVALHISEIVLGKRYLSRVRRFERSFYDGTVIDGARFFKRDTFARVGGFDEILFRTGSGEDWDIDKSIKKYGKVKLLQNINGLRSPSTWPLAQFIENRGVEYNQFFSGIYHNESEFCLKKYLRKKLYYSQGFDGYIKKWGRGDSDIKQQFGLYYRYFGVFIEHGKWKKLLSNPNLTIGMYFLRFCVGVVYLSRKVLR